MEKYIIPITWEGYADIEIEAENLDEAVNKVELDSDELVLPEDWDLVEGSIEVNYRMTEVLNPGCKLKEKEKENDKEE